MSNTRSIGDNGNPTRMLLAERPGVRPHPPISADLAHVPNALSRTERAPRMRAARVPSGLGRARLFCAVRSHGVTRPYRAICAPCADDAGW
jgi:hypothetical protein